MILKETREKVKDYESLHRAFLEEVNDDKLLKEINRLLKQDGQKPLEKLTTFDIAEARLAPQYRLKCRECDPEYCDGWIYKLTRRGDSFVGSWAYCRKKHKYELIKQLEEEGKAEKVKRQLGVESLWELFLKQL